ncbi:MAG: Imm57 family immunity protein [Porticoccaceae bacterium]
MNIGRYGLLLSIAILVHPDHVLAEDSDEINAAIDYADSAILYEHMRSASPEGRSECLNRLFSCSGPQRWELALALLGSLGTDTSDRALVGLVRFRLDAALAEEHSHWVLTRGKRLTAWLKKIDIESLHKKCMTEAQRLKVGRSGLYLDVAIEDVCASAQEIQSRVSEYLEMVKRPIEEQEP